MRRWLFLLAGLAMGGVPHSALATHTEDLRSAGDEFSVSTDVLALFAVTTFLVVGAIIFMGYRYLYRYRDRKE